MAKAQKFTVISCKQSEENDRFILALTITKQHKGIIGTKTVVTTYRINGIEEEVKVGAEFDVDLTKDYDVEERPYSFSDEETGELTTRMIKWLVPFGTAKDEFKVAA